jgi:hypothetical protein
MNERIQELAEQAEVTGYFAAGTEYATPIPLTPELQKFAELIVKECIKVIKDSEGYSQYFPHVTDNVEKKFGVEE